MFCISTEIGCASWRLERESTKMKRFLIVAAISALSLPAYCNGSADFVKRYEGFRTSAYRCTAGIKTIGYGFTANHMVAKGSITRVDADKELKRLCDEVAEKLRRELRGQRLTKGEEMAVVSFAYNIGWGNFKTSRVLALLKQGKRGSIVAEEIRKWVYVTKGGKKLVCKGLKVRRLREAAMFVRG